VGHHEGDEVGNHEVGYPRRRFAQHEDHEERPTTKAHASTKVAKVDYNYRAATAQANREALSWLRSSAEDFVFFVLFASPSWLRIGGHPFRQPDGLPFVFFAHAQSAFVVNRLRGEPTSRVTDFVAFAIFVPLI
jgi:hypothetical protein